ncbi:MAG: hypothetical protein AAGF60_02775 [Pseudomonadota bacterium]
MSEPSQFPTRDIPSDVRAVLDRMSQLPVEDRTPTALAAAAHLMEFAAYELARSEEAQHVARLILMAADMERTAQSLSRKGR